MHSKGKIIPQNPLFMRTSGIILFIQRQIQAERTEITLLPIGNFQTLQGPQKGKLGSGMVFSTIRLKIIPTRQVKTRSKLFCIDRLIPFGFI